MPRAADGAAALAAGALQAISAQHACENAKIGSRDMPERREAESNMDERYD